MAGKGSSTSNPKPRKRVEVADDSSPANNTSMVRAKDGSAFVKCEGCNKDVAVVLISMHSCSLDAKIRSNLESQVVEKPAEVKKPAERKKATSAEPKAKRTKTEKKPKKSKDPNGPKRPATAFFLFMDDFRKAYKEANPDSKGVTGVAKEGGEKWKSMTEEEKKPYVDKAAELKAEYEKALESQNAEPESNDDEEAPKDEEAAKDEDAVENEVEEITDED